MRVDGSLRSLLQGVSQQPARDRLAGQATAQINMSSDPVTGLTKRPPTDLVDKLLTSSTVQGWNNFQTKNGSKFLTCIDGTTVKVWDYNAVAKTVTQVSGAAYLTAGKFAFGTVEDTTYIANKNVTVAMGTAVKTYYNKQANLSAALITVLGGGYTTSYAMKLNNVDCGTYTTPRAIDFSAEPYIKTDDIANQIVKALTNAAGSTNYPSSTTWNGTIVSTGAMSSAPWTVTRTANQVLITNSSGTPFTFTIDDGEGNSLSKAMVDTVKTPADLPAHAPHGYVVRVAQHTDPAKDLWLQFFVNGWTTGTALGSGFGLDGFWQEVVADQIPYPLNAATMPTTLVYDSVADTFAYSQGVWKDRRAGSDISNPNPSFVGNSIQDVFTFQGRLGFLAGSNAILSVTDQHDDYWFQSVQTEADSDPIDISSTAVEASIMTAAVPNNKDLIIFSREGQFIMFGRTSLTHQNAALTLTTAFEAELNAHPVSGGANIFFANNFGKFTGMREFFADGNSDINDSRPITQHVNKYIVGKATKLTSSSNYNLLIVQTDADPKTIYPYQYIWNDTTKIQSAWSTWVLNREVVYSFFDEELLYFVVHKNNDYHLYRMSLDVQASDGMEYPIFLDSRFDVPGCGTSFILPDVDLHDETIIAVQGVGCPNPGLRAEIQSIALVGSDWVVTLKRDMLGGNVIAGVPWRTSYKPTMPFVKDSDNVVVGTGKLRVRDFLVTVQDTGGMYSVVTSEWGDQDPVEFTARDVGSVDNRVGQPAIFSGQFIVPFRSTTSQAELEVYSEDHLPLTVVDIEWIGQYNKRGKRISIGGQGNTNVGASN